MTKENYHHGNLKNELIQKGIELINSEGLEKLSLRKLANLCGVSHAAPYNHFGDKDNFVICIKKQISDEFAQELMNSVNKRPDINDAMMELGVAYVEFFIKNPQYFYFLINQPDIDIEFTDSQIIKAEYPAFQIFHETAIKYLSHLNVPDELKIQKIITMWALVQGISAISIMKGVHYNGNFGELTRRILC